MEGVLDNPPWGSEQVVLTFEGEEPDAYMLAEGLSQKVFKGPTGGGSNLTSASPSRTSRAPATG